MNQKTVSIDPKLLMDLIYWARRYCDRRSTYAPNSFNEAYHKIMEDHPELKELDKKDDTLMDDGQYWPYAQDGMYDKETGFFDISKPYRAIK